MYNLLTIFYTFIITLALGIALFQFLLFFRLKDHVYRIFLALAAFSASIVGVFEMLYIGTTSVKILNSGIRWQHLPVATMIIGLSWFLYYYFGKKLKPLVWIITGLWILTLLINFSVKGNILFKEITELIPVQMWGKETVYFANGIVNPLKYIADLATLCFIIFTAALTFQELKTGSRRKAIVTGGSTLFFILIAGIQTPLMDAGIVKTPPIIAASFTFITLAVSLDLFNEVIAKKGLELKLTHQLNRWTTLLDNVHLFVVAIDLRGTITYTNPYTCEKIGKSYEEINGQNWFEHYILEKDQEKVKREVIGLSKGENFKHSQNQIRCASGLVDVLWSNVYLQDETGDNEIIIGVGADISRRVKAYEEIRELKEKLELENLLLKTSFGSLNHNKIIGKSDELHYALYRIKQVAKSDTTVLIEGETGVGKELFAEALHQESDRNQQNLFKFNCAAFPETLVESELFGHEKGAFTGASMKRIGRFEVADKGTLFLDEIGEMSLELQAKLLRIIETGEFERLGSNKTIRVDVRIIAATNRNLQQEVQKKTFREDLYYRLNAFPVTIPPLRKRKEDIPLLTNHFIEEFARKHGKQFAKLNKHAISLLQDYEWPGNIRELRNVIQRAVILSDPPVLSINEKVLMRNGKPEVEQMKSLELMEKEYIEQVLVKCKWKVEGTGGAAHVLEMNPSTLRNRINKLGIKRPGSVS